MREEFKQLLSESVGPEAASVVLDALEEAPAVSVRLNPAKYPATQWPGAAGQVPWNENAFFLAERPAFTLDPLLHGGAYYVQDSSAMFPGRLFREILPLVKAEGHLRILDLCAAPGGKTTDILSSLDGLDYLLVSNEISSSRVTVLCDNVARWGESRVSVTSADPAAFAPIEGFFDIIVADVPCSGEGMFRKDPEALRQWSPDNVALCQARQRRILSDVWPSLREGGILIYSTCTFNHLENDDNVRWISESLGAEVLNANLNYSGVLKTEAGFALLPGFVRGEGQYCAALRKTSATSAIKIKKNSLRPEARNVWLDGDFTVVRKGELLCALPQALVADAAVLERLKPLRTGTAVGTEKGKDFIPHADLALARCLSQNAFARYDVSLDTALAFLHKESFSAADAPRGYLLVTYKGLPLGFVKNLGNRCNNLLPQGRRIRMDL
ncbi:MAG: rRNA cytosine-C5-methyltransferase [Bacteroidales bacterium]|nr:rRNA cytosine-C5-methyltransferase [Bacteroidales bacterium]